MKNKRTISFLTVLLLCMLVVAPCLIGPVYAAEPESCSLTLTYEPDDQPMAGVQFQAYRVADVDMARVCYHATEAYAGYRVLNNSGSWLERASTLAAYVARDQLAPDAQADTDEDGQLLFAALEPGLYLVTGAAAFRGNIQYIPTPFLLSLPNTLDGRAWEYDVATHVKYTFLTIGGGTTQRHALKVWDDDGNEEERPASVTVDLLRDGEVYASAVLSAENNWRYDWTNLPADANWQVAERDLDENYTVSIQTSGISFVITNSYQPEIPDEDPPLIDQPQDPGGGDDDDFTTIDDEDPPLANLPQTGLLWWPVPLMVMLGIVLLCFGCVLHRKGIRNEEE